MASPANVQRGELRRCREGGGGRRSRRCGNGAVAATRAGEASGARRCHGGGGRGKGSRDSPCGVSALGEVPHHSLSSPLNDTGIEHEENDSLCVSCQMAFVRRAR